MKINLSEIYERLKVLRDERDITEESQKEGYFINMMEGRDRQWSSENKFRSF